jgi:hypothetical protein
MQDARLSQVATLAQAGHTEEALALLADLAEQGEPMALMTLADFRWFGGEPVPRDPVAGPRALPLGLRSGRLPSGPNKKGSRSRGSPPRLEDPAA